MDVEAKPGESRLPPLTAPPLLLRDIHARTFDDPPEVLGWGHGEQVGLVVRQIVRLQLLLLLLYLLCPRRP